MTQTQFFFPNLTAIADLPEKKITCPDCHQREVTVKKMEDGYIALSCGCSFRHQNRIAEIKRRLK